jgi:hypothetical protein
MEAPSFLWLSLYLGCQDGPRFFQCVGGEQFFHDAVQRFQVEPENKLVSVFTLQENKSYGRPEVYAEEHTIKVGAIHVSLHSAFEIDLNSVFV